MLTLSIGRSLNIPESEVEHLGSGEKSTEGPDTFHLGISLQ